MPVPNTLGRTAFAQGCVCGRPGVRVPSADGRSLARWCADPWSPQCPHVLFVAFSRCSKPSQRQIADHLLDGIFQRRLYTLWPMPADKIYLNWYGFSQILLQVALLVASWRGFDRQNHCMSPHADIVGPLSALQTKNALPAGVPSHLATLPTSISAPSAIAPSIWWSPRCSATTR